MTNSAAERRERARSLARTSLALAAAFPLALVGVEVLRPHPHVTSFTDETVLGVLLPLAAISSLIVASLVVHRRARRLTKKNRAIARLNGAALLLALLDVALGLLYATWTLSIALMQAVMSGVR